MIEVVCCEMWFILCKSFVDHAYHAFVEILNGRPLLLKLCLFYFLNSFLYVKKWC